jgi:hypothetical protein
MNKYDHAYYWVLLDTLMIWSCMMMKNKYIYFIIYLLTILDILFTAVGLRLGLIEEANPIISYLFNLSMGLSVLCVLLFVGIMLIFLYKASQKIHWLHKALTGLAAIKIYVLLLHLKWISSYFNMGI